MRNVLKPMKKPFFDFSEDSKKLEEKNFLKENFVKNIFEFFFSSKSEQKRFGKNKFKKNVMFQGGSAP